MIYNHRCSDRANCGKRKTLRRHIDDYIRRPVCPNCGEDRLKFDPSVRRQTMKQVCRCIGVRFPHRSGTVINENEFCKTLELVDVQYILEARKH